MAVRSLAQLQSLYQIILSSKQLSSIPHIRHYCFKTCLSPRVVKAMAALMGQRLARSALDTMSGMNVMDVINVMDVMQLYMCSKDHVKQ